MANTESIDWSNRRSLRQRALRSIREFFGKEEEEHALSPEKIAEAAEEGSGEGALINPVGPEEEDPNAGRVHRPTEQRKISDSPSTLWPG